MPELDFKGKEFVRNHHLVVPYHPLIADAEKSVGEPDLDGNLIIQGDNLHALKSLLPKYAGKVDCIFIDPPYNTGNEGWSYNDNVNSPELKAWFKDNPVGVDDGLRHDKWCCMMWPRLRLLWELLAEDGSLWMTLDDNEAHRATSLMLEIAGNECMHFNIAWIKRYTRSNNATTFSSMKDHLICFGKSMFKPGRESRSSDSESTYSNPDNDARGPWITASYVNPASRENRPNLCYPIINPHTGEQVEHPTNAWKFSQNTHQSHVDSNLLYWGETGEYRYPRLKIHLTESMVASDVWTYDYAGSTDTGTKQLEAIFQSKVFDNPKPFLLVERCIEIGSVSKQNSLILDSFAGSGTTAHAVLKMNAQDGGNRKFILVEMEDYADSLTAERVRRVINGYPYQGTQRETLLERKLTWSEIKKAETLLEEVKNTEAAYKDQFDKITTKVEKGVLKVTGERNVKEKAPGLGGSFTYCTLGEPLEIEKLLDPEGSLPAFDSLAEWLRHTAGAGDKPVPITGLDAELAEWSLGRHSDVAYWLIYRPDREFLTSPDAALTLDLARRIAKTAPGRHRVFSAAKYVGAKVLRDEKIEIDHVPLPFTLFRGNR